MKQVPDKSIDLILCDLPYGTTENKWDTVIPFDKLWAQYKRIIKDNGAIVLFGDEPFSSCLRSSNSKLYRYDWYWIKSNSTGFLNARKMPMKQVETISVFYKHLPTYNPQGLIELEKPVVSQNGGNKTCYQKKEAYVGTKKYTNYPRNVLTIESEPKVGRLHPSQKPIELLEYLINTYTNEGDTVLDNCMGSGSTGVACKNTNREFIGMEMDEKYYKIACERLGA
jgi:site-specific DNA-methyltransferase (adenine-specific)